MTRTLEVGDKAPGFSLASEGGKMVSLKDFSGKPFVLYFYPKDDTPGCTKEAIGFSAAAAGFNRLGVSVVGVSKDSTSSHERFKKKHNLTVKLGSDPDGKTIESYGCWVEKSMYGRTYMGIERATFLVNGKGRIAKIWRKVKVAGHVEEVLAAIRSL